MAKQSYSSSLPAMTANCTGIQGFSSMRGLTWLLSGILGIGLGSAGFHFAHDAPWMIQVKKPLHSLVDDHLSQKPLPALTDGHESNELFVEFLASPSVNELQPVPELHMAMQNEAGDTVFSQEEAVLVNPERATTPSVNKTDDWQLTDLDLSEFSPEMASAIAQVLDESQPDESVAADLLTAEVRYKLPKDNLHLSGRLPALDLQTHMYASDPSRRWVKINGQELQEGDTFGQGLQLLEITPRYILLSFDQQQIEIPALYEWKG